MKVAVVLVVVLAGLVAQVGDAAAATFASRDLEVLPGTTRVLEAPRFELVGLHWRGNGAVRLSARSASGRWGAWRDAARVSADRPDGGVREGLAGQGWHVGDPLWLGESTAIRYRVTGRISALRAFFVRSRSAAVPLRTTSAAGQPAVVVRAMWGADESIRKGAPQYADTLRSAIVHHTAGTNDYTRAQAPAVVRGIQLYHVRSNGWNDIGYNFLVDRFGVVYEGRYGGIDRNVIGAHAKGFNTGSVGVAVIGSFDPQGISPAARSSLAALLAWRLDIAHVDPLTTLTTISSGSDRFPAGVPVFLRAVSGHRDTGLTACPGEALYAELGSIAAETQARGLPKLYEPRVTGKVGGLVRFRARLSTALPWSVSVTDSAGATLASGSGSSATVDWTWDSATAMIAGARWRITAGAGVTAAAGSLGSLGSGGGPVVVPVALAITGAASDPETISPNADGAADVTTLGYSTSTVATVDVTLLDATGAVVTQLLEPMRKPGGRHTLVFDGLGLPDGGYTFAVSAIGDAGERVSASVPVRLTRTLARAALEPAVFAPTALRRPRSLNVGFELAAAANVRVRVLRGGRWVATPFSGPLQPGPQSIGWDGAKRLGRALDGAYTAVVEATDAIGTSSISLPFTMDVTSPRLRLLPGRKPRLLVSEPSALVLHVNGRVSRIDMAAAGAVALRGIRVLRSLVAVAEDRAGNRSVLRHRRVARPAAK